MAAGCPRCGGPMTANVDGTTGEDWTDNCTRCGATIPRQGPPPTLRDSITVETVPQTGEKLVYTRDHGQSFDRIAAADGSVVMELSEDGRTAIIRTPEGLVAVEGVGEGRWTEPPPPRLVSDAEAQELLNRRPLEGGTFKDWKQVEEFDEPPDPDLPNRWHG